MIGLLQRVPVGVLQRVSAGDRLEVNRDLVRVEYWCLIK